MLNVVLLGLLVLLNFSLGSSKRKSMFGIKNCSPAYWVIYVAFLVICLIFTAFAVWIAKKEQALKQKFGNINLV